ncbi:hypothetical protein HANVADRAFT_28880 [Hanseniaspora valbyensis NRRL Y-1626]|uniref:Large ribosomal subunit protein mL46 N-terminal domain-containing protein n=1 Tax=Hanseniaspora valbyensis NRRL Y-1626 TaxID=766949 RepID=A0A1B7TIZ6_9ASCO|nr:hypothetical protein HANVADRAFT_28880 [Hanseniaspora valbyensis NRRL Y-1626]
MFKSTRSLKQTASTTLSNLELGLIVKRLPLVTKSLSSYEQNYYAYKQEIYDRMALNFPKEYYFPSGSMKTIEFENVQPKTASIAQLTKHDGKIVYPNGKPELNYYGRDMNEKHEVILVEEVKEELAKQNAKMGDAKKNAGDEYVKFNDRITESDLKKDYQQLDRSLENDLYLVIKNNKSQNEKWGFPKFKAGEALQNNKNVSLDELALKELYQVGGENMQLWTISKTPAKLLDNTLYFKNVIFSGNFKSEDASIEYKWLNKKELKDILDKEYYEEMEYLLS